MAAGSFLGLSARDFTNVTDLAGVDYLQKRELSADKTSTLQVNITGGAAAGDYDNDGWVDLFITRHDDPPILFRNKGDGTFEDITVTAGLDQAQPSGSNGAAWGDIDNDGDLDLYVTAYNSSRFYLYINDGEGRFTEEAVTRALRWPMIIRIMGRVSLLGITTWTGIWISMWPSGGGTTKSKTHTVCLPINRLLRNLGGGNPGHFEDVTVAAGVSLDGVEGDSMEGTYGFAPRFSDLDRDGHPDLVVVSDFEESRLFWNNGNSTFSDGTAAGG